jgi:hypothetical protein
MEELTAGGTISSELVIKVRPTSRIMKYSRINQSASDWATISEPSSAGWYITAYNCADITMSKVTEVSSILKRFWLD